MAEWSCSHDHKWVKRLIGIDKVRVQYNGMYGTSTHPTFRELGQWRLNPVRSYRIRPDFYQSKAWQTLCETACVFDGTNWTPKKGSE